VLNNLVKSLEVKPAEENSSRDKIGFSRHKDFKKLINFTSENKKRVAFKQKQNK
jgi:hypothetical protein